MEERWLPVVGFESHYSVSERGNLKSTATKSGRPREFFLRPYANGNGYLAFRFQVGTARHKIYMHRVVWQAFRGTIPKGLEINHKNGVKSDNRLENLELVNRSENVLHSLALTGRVDNQPRGSRHGQAKLCEGDIPTIRSLLAAGCSYKQVGAHYGVSGQAIGYIARNKHWRHA